jgi:hypothetical protein
MPVLQLIAMGVMACGAVAVLLSTTADTIALTADFQSRKNALEKEKSDFNKLLNSLKYVAGKTENKFVKVRNICSIEEKNCNREGFVIYASKTDAVWVVTNVAKREFTYQRSVINKEGKWVSISEPETYSATDAKQKISALIENAAVAKAKSN